MKRLSRHAALLASLAVPFVGLTFLPLDASAARGGGGHARTSVNRAGSANINRGANIDRSANLNRSANLSRSANIDRSANINRNTNVNIDRDVDRRWNHPVATGVAIATTAAVIGSVIYSLPPSCSTLYVNGTTYQQCGSTWYRPRYAGTSVQYVVVDSPY